METISTKAIDLVLNFKILSLINSCVTLIDLQLDAQNSYLFIYNTFIKILYMFRALLCSSSEGPRRNCIHEAFTTAGYHMDI
jgi:hypothetical protein